MALCARAECSVTHYHQLAQEAAKFTEWEKVPAQAEAHGLGPLLYVHLLAAGVPFPPTVKRELLGLYLRHRQSNRVRMRVLHDILTAYDAAGIQALVLKGGALSHLVYPEPGLRPMSDLDILVPKSELWQAQGVLIELGFDASLPSDSTLPHRHLPLATLHTEGLAIHVEIHHKLFSDYFDSAISYVHSKILPVVRPIAQVRAFCRKHILPARLLRTRQEHGGLTWEELDSLTVPPYPFALGDLTAYTLGCEDMLWHLCQHLASHVNVWDFGRLIWVADIVSFAERFVSEIDWKWIRRQYPAVLDMLSLLHFMTPLSDELLNQASINIGHIPQGIGVEYQGWPRTKVVHWRERGYWCVLRDTFFPSEWWLRLRYKLGSARSLFWYRWVRHPLYILGHVVRAILEWMGWPTSLELARGREPK
jgi:hypothetical protein